MCVKKVQAYVDSRNIIHHREDTALMTEINILTGLKNSDIATLRKHARPLIALLDALAACDDATESENVTGSDTAKKDPWPGHEPACRARACDNVDRCNCVDIQRDDDNSYSGPSVTRTTELEM